MDEKTTDMVGRPVVGTAQPTSARPHLTPAIRPAQEIPLASGWPLIGSVPHMTGDLRSFLTREYLKHGPVFRIHAFNRRYIALAGPEANSFVQKQGSHFLRSHEAWQSFNAAMGAKDGLTAMDGPAHVRMRKTHARAFSQSFIEGRLDEVVKITRRISSRWIHDEVVSVQYAIQTIIAEQLAILTTGVSAVDEIDDLILLLENLLRVHVMGQSPPLALRLPRIRRADRRLRELHNRVLAHHKREDREHHDLIDDLLQLHSTDPQLLPETDLRLAVLGPFFAGIETAASTCAFLLYAVLKDPDLLQRLTTEADTLLSEEPLSAAGLRNMDVTHRVVMETLRMYPSVPAIMRTVANSFVFAGYELPAGAKVIVGNAVPHHLSECYPDPQRFDIDRYAPDRAEHRQPGAYAPFGLGTHRCLGSGFAEVQIALTLLTLFHDFDFEMHPHNYELKIKHTPSPRPASSFKIRVERRHRIR